MCFYKLYCDLIIWNFHFSWHHIVISIILYTGKKENNNPPPPETCNHRLLLSEKSSRCPLIQSPTDSSATLQRADLEQMVPNTYMQMHNSRKFTTAFGLSVYQM